MSRSPVRLPRSTVAPTLAALINSRTSLLSRECGAPAPVFDVLIALEPLHDSPQAGVQASRKAIMGKIQTLYPGLVLESTQFYIQLEGTAEQVRAISDLPGVEMVWPNEFVSHHVVVSAETVRASAGWRTFSARGKGITWAVLDTGIQALHPQFRGFKDPAGVVTPPTVDESLSISFVPGGKPLEDPNGHGTHVAGIIAGALPQEFTEELCVRLESDNPDAGPIRALDGRPSGLAPAARLISVQVLGREGGDKTFACIKGLEYIRCLNQTSSDLVVDGANLSFGYPLDAISHGCGYSPICEEVNRAVQAGICVVVSCGNAGYGVASAQDRTSSTLTHVGLSVSISDPANADLCIAVGSVHKSAPHKFGISYFSSKGPTLDGRKKPDLVAPGERIHSCNAFYRPSAPSVVSAPAAVKLVDSGIPAPTAVGTEDDDTPLEPAYVEMSGTSMAAPHVSGAIASFLSVRPDFRGKPHEIKEIFKASAIDLGRDPAYQGSGLVDVFKALTSV